MNYLELHFQATKCKDWPKLKFYVDEDLYQEYMFEFEQGIIQIPLELMPGPHQLEIELYGKTFDNTIVKDDVIIEDQLVTLNKMLIDGVELPAKFLYHGRLENNPSSPSLTWGINGKWIWNFEEPIINWALMLFRQDNTNKIDTTITSMFSEEKNKKLLSILDEIEKELKNVKI